MKIVNNVAVADESPSLGDVYYKNNRDGAYYILAKTQNSVRGELYNLISLRTGLRFWKDNKDLVTVQGFFASSEKFEKVPATTITLS